MKKIFAGIITTLVVFCFYVSTARFIAKANGQRVSENFNFYTTLVDYCKLCPLPTVFDQYVSDTVDFVDNFIQIDFSSFGTATSDILKAIGYTLIYPIKELVVTAKFIAELFGWVISLPSYVKGIY